MLVGTFFDMFLFCHFFVLHCIFFTDGIFMSEERNCKLWMVYNMIMCMLSNDILITDYKTKCLRKCTTKNKSIQLFIRPRNNKSMYTDAVPGFRLRAHKRQTCIVF